MENYFSKFYSVNVSAHIEKKNNLSYLSWPYAWAALKMEYPKSDYKIYKNEKGWNYFTDGKTCWVEVGVTVVTDDFSLEHIEMLPVMDYRNNSIPWEKVTSFDINKAQKRALVKAIADHGLGLCLYAGEDIPQDVWQAAEEKAQALINGTIKPQTFQRPPTQPTVQPSVPTKGKKALLEDFKAMFSKTDADISVMTQELRARGKISPQKTVNSMSEEEFNRYIMDMADLSTNQAVVE